MCVCLCVCVCAVQTEQGRHQVRGLTVVYTKRAWAALQRDVIRGACVCVCVCVCPLFQSDAV